jgi:hypothetical protein
MGASKRKWGSRFRLEEVEPSFKEFLASSAMMRLVLMSIKPDVGRVMVFLIVFSALVCPR